jgi:hypothetical protein
MTSTEWPWKEKAVYPRVVKQVGTAPPQYPDLDEDE